MAEKYIVSCDFFLDWQSVNQVLTNFYQPMIGATAIAAYLTLSQKWIQTVERNKKKYSTVRSMIKTLLKQLQLTNETFITIRQKLEAIGLLQTYFLPQEMCWVFMLQPCLRETAFCRDQRFLGLIKTTTEDNNYVLDYCETNSTLNLNISNEVSVNFDDVFNKSHKLELNLGWNEVFQKTNKALLAKNYDVNSYFYYRREIIKKINFYELPLPICPRLIVLSYQQKTNGDNVFSYTHFSNMIENNYQHYQNKTNIPTTPEHFESNHTKRLCLKKPFWQKKMQLMKLINSYEYGVRIFKIVSPTMKSTMFNLIHNLKINYHLQQPIINCLLEFVMLKNQGEFNKNEIIKLAQQFYYLKIHYLEEAILFLCNLMNYQWTPKVEGVKITPAPSQVL